MWGPSERRWRRRGTEGQGEPINPREEDQPAGGRSTEERIINPRGLSGDGARGGPWEARMLGRNEVGGRSGHLRGQLCSVGGLAGWTGWRRSEDRGSRGRSVAPTEVGAILLEYDGGAW